jgi:acyl-CoA thioesterase
MSQDMSREAHPPATDADDLARRSAAAMYADDHAARHLGIHIDTVTSGRATLSMVVTETMVNGHGLCHGGYIFTLADTAFAYACNSYGQRTVAQHAEITFVAPGQRGMRLIAMASERHRASRSGIYDITVRNDLGDTIAEFRGLSRTIAGTLA